MTKQKKVLWIGVIIGVMLFGVTLFADVPSLIDYQGRLTDDNGDPVNGTVSIEFKIYADSTGGTALWTETQTVVVSEGLFQVSLGEVTLLALTFEDDSHWLGINVNSDGEMTPRTRITSVAYAINSRDVKGNDIHPGSVSIDGYGEVINSSGEWTGETISVAGDNLGDHTATQNLDMNNNKITNLSTPTADSDAVTKAYADSTSGDNLGDHTAISDLDMTYHKITHLLSPTTDYQAANKMYVDSHGDNLGDHTATQNIDLNGYYLSGDGGIEIDEASNDGVYVYHAGIPTNQHISSVKNGFEVAGTEGYGLYVGHADYSAIRVVNTDGAGAAISNTGTCGIKVSDAGTDGFLVETAGDNLFQGGEDGSEVFEVSNTGDVTATSFTGDGSGLTGISGDNLGDHTATQNVIMDGNWLSEDGDNEGVFVAFDGDVGIGTSSPGAVLDVEGSGTYGLRVTETGGANTVFAVETGAEVTLAYGSNECARLGTDGGPAGFLDLKNVGTSKVRISSSSSYDTYFNAGDVGIGTTTPATDLEVNGTISTDELGIGTTTPEFNLSLDNDGGIMAKGTYGSGTNLSTTGAGARMFWYPKKAAFRAGGVSGTDWDNTNIGNYSAGFGYNAYAYGQYSFAGGYNTEAGGSYSTAFGNASTANGNGAVSLGYQNTAGGNYAVSLGRECDATTTTSVAIGGYSESRGIGSVALGYYASVGTSDDGSVAIGKSVSVDDDYSVALGTDVTVSGSNSVGIGKDISVTANYATALGFSCTASRNHSKTFGSWCEANGDLSIAMGDNTNADAYDSFTLGRYNIGGGTNNSWISTDPLFEIGIGTSDANRENAVTVLKNGNVGIGTDDPDELLHVDGTLKIGSAETIEDGGYYQLAFNSDLRATTDNYYDLGSSSYRWDDVYATNGTIQTSDRRDKENITKTKYGLKEIMKLDPVSFNWKGRSDEGKKLGLIAQDLLKIIPEVVKTHDYKVVDEETGRKEKVELERMGVYYSDLIPVLIKAIQEQQETIEKLQTEVELLKQK